MKAFFAYAMETKQGMRILLADLRYAWRRARQQPGVTLSIVLLLALGMGGVTTVFDPIYSTLFVPLPLPQPEQLVRIGGNLPLLRIGTGRLEHEETLGRIFSNTAAYYQYNAQIRIPDTGEQLEVNALRVTEDFFETLGVKPLIGNLNNKENNAGFIVSHKFWRNKLMQKNEVVGSYILSPDGSPLPIIGVMPEGFDFPFNTDIWDWRRSGATWSNTSIAIDVVGRLRPGVPRSLAAEELRPLGKTLFLEVAGIQVVRSGDGPVLQSLQIHIYGDQRPMLRMLGAAAILFFALVCTGVINLLIAQGMKRKQEIAIRLVHGATRRNVIFQLMRETLPLVVIGGLAGWCLSGIAGAWMWAQMPALRSGAVNVPAGIAFWAALVLAVTFIGGLIPSLYATRLDLNTYLKSASGGKRRFLSTQEFLVGVQLSLSLALLIGVGLLIRSMMFNVDIPIGWSSRDVVVVSVTQSRMDTSSRELAMAASLRRTELNQNIRSALSSMPEVLTVGVLSPIPFSQRAIRNEQMAGMMVDKTLPSQSTMAGEWGITINSTSVSPDGFTVLGVPLIIGRNLTETDESNRVESMLGGPLKSYSMAIINQAFAERLWPGENPVGSMFYDMNRSTYEVVGVVRNFHHTPGSRDFTPRMYVPVVGLTNIEFLVKLRPNTSFASFHTNARQRLSGFTLDWIEARPLGKYVENVTVNQRLVLQSLIVFAVLGIIVAGLAVYLIAALAAAARTKETGIRMAMGATTWDILKLAFWRGIRAIIVGLPFGLFLALILSKVLASFLVQLNIRDPLAWVISCAVLLVIAAVAALIPALRASRVNPLDALRDE